LFVRLFLFYTKYIIMAKSYKRYKNSKKNNRKMGKSRKYFTSRKSYTTTRRRIGGLLAKPGNSTYKAVLEAAKRGEQGTPIANPFGSKTIIATELPTMSRQ